ncbi:hypothetical protein SDC9_201391 [bioreactor metagenome]|uniref:Uncharacterized protein n=1 Tax=bioreactor metagenome TaxID=1076179 RepID=A0A645IQS5_9ZZZZ
MESEIEVFPSNSLGVIEHRDHAQAFHRTWNRDRAQVAQCGIDVQKVDQTFILSICRDAGACQYQRHPQAVLIEILLAHKAMLTDGQPIVATEYDNGVFGKASVVECLQYGSQTPIDVAYHGIIVGDVLSDFLRFAGVCFGILVSAFGRPSETERGHLLEIRRKGDF